MDQRRSPCATNGCYRCGDTPECTSYYIGRIDQVLPVFRGVPPEPAIVSHVKQPVLVISSPAGMVQARIGMKGACWHSTVYQIPRGRKSKGQDTIELSMRLQIEMSPEAVESLSRLEREFSGNTLKKRVQSALAYLATDSYFTFDQYVREQISFFSCFLSSSSDDAEFTRKLYADLKARRVLCWFAPEDLKGGDRFRERIEDSIWKLDKSIVILSATSMASDWVEAEVESVFERERKEKKDLLVPLRIDDAVVSASSAWAKDLYRRRHILDFSQWCKPESYRDSFARLLRSITRETEASRIPRKFVTLNEKGRPAKEIVLPQLL